ncbi:MAG: hypothetical protein COA73_04110 [Candidatus Hydrogenedentota bacterium]|nr:MAG: hypothetical protein COA73_04110 [Candidatus Hydrogenedentota bacterium]
MKSSTTYLISRWKNFLPILIIIFGITLSIHAYTDVTVEQALKNLANALLLDPNLAPETKKALTQVIEALDSERQATATITSSPEIRTPKPSGSSTLKKEKFSFSGDLRLRQESSMKLDTSPDRHRQRLRLRFGGEVQLTSEVRIGARLVTGDADDPKSTHQTLGNNFSSLEVSFDRIFLNYSPQWLENGWITVGKFDHPFMRNPIYNGLVWDSDVQPEGLVFGYTLDSFPGVDRVKLVLGKYIFQERGKNDNAYVAAAQLSIHKTFTDQLTGNAAIGYYSYSNLDMADIIGMNSGNALLDFDNDGTPDAFASKFGILNPIASLTYTGWKKPVTISTEYIHNLRANVSEDMGWALGIALGETKKKGDWKVYYQWQKVEQDAVFSLVSQDDFLVTTNFSGHVTGTRYQFTDTIQLHLWALISQRGIPDKTAGQTRQSQWRLRSDVNIKF